MNDRIPLFDFWWLGAAARNWLVIALAMAIGWESQQLWLCLLGVLVIGNRQHALVILQHDGTHYHLSRNKRLNNLAMDILTAWPMAFSSSGYRRYHFAHHRALGTEADPELATYGRFAAKWSPDANVLKLFLCDLLGCGTPEVLVLWDDVMKSRDAEAKVACAVEIAGMILWPVAVGSAIVLFSGWPMLGYVAALWYLSLFTSFFAVFRLRAYSEHVGSDWTHRWHKPALWRRLLYLPENTWLHWEHHTWPGIPLRQLRERAATEQPARATQAVSLRQPAPADRS